MQIEHPNAPALTVQEQEQLDKLKAVIERATADGKLTSAESETIQKLIRADHQISVEELGLVRELITNQIQQGKLVIDWEEKH
ncbi:MAG: hypothetical protein ACTS2F_18875 [Thainema sp.]